MEQPTSASLTDALATALRGRAEVHVAILFGSGARGQLQWDSDVDVAIVGPGVDPLELAAELSEALNRETDVVLLGEDPSVPLLDAIIRQGLVVHEGSRGQAASWRARMLLQLETDRPWYARMREAWLERVARTGLP